MDPINITCTRETEFLVYKVLDTDWDRYATLMKNKRQVLIENGVERVLNYALRLDPYDPILSAGAIASVFHLEEDEVCIKGHE